MFNDPLAQLARRWVYRIRRPDSGTRKSNAVRLAVGGLEDRLAPAQLPAATVFESRVLSADDSITSKYQFGVSAAQSVLDPRVFAIASTNGEGVTLQVSTNGGQSFGTTFTTVDANNATNRITDVDGKAITPPPFETRPQFRLADPATTDGNPLTNDPAVPYTNSSSPAIAIGRDGLIYMVHTQHNAANTSGAVVAQRFSAGGGLQSTTVIYRWLDVDPAYNPTITVDNNLPTILDPEGKAPPRTDANPNGLVVVAYGTNATPANAKDTGYAPRTDAMPWNPNQVMLAISGDSGSTFSSPTRVNDVGYFSQTNPLTGAADPVLAFGPDGRLTTFWASVLDTKTNPDPILDQSQDPLDSSAFVDTFRLDPTATAVRIAGAAGTIPDAVIIPNVTPHQQGVFKSTITIANADTDARFSNFRDLSDLDVDVALTHLHLNQVTVTLTSPTGTVITLLAPRTDTSGMDAPVPTGPFGFQTGLPDSKPNLGRIDPGTGQISFTVFDDQAARKINDPDNKQPYLARYKPHSGSLATISNAITTRSQLTGDWVLTVTDNRNNTTDPPEIQQLEGWGLRFTSQFDNNGLGTDTQVQTLFPTIFPLQSGLIATHPLTGAEAPASPTLGIGPGISVAYDESFSPDVDSSHPGRLYVAYTERHDKTGADADVMLAFSDDGGLSWNAPTRVNDDIVTDNRTEGNRAQFQPAVAVDPTTGTVGVTWYDTRNDADKTRPSRFFASSIDGGLTFSPQVALNAPKTAVDAITNTANTLEVRPDNFVQAGTDATGLGGGTGVGQSLLAFGGKFYPFWTGNQNGIGGTTKSQILTATVRTASGPRIIGSDLGAVTETAVAGSGDLIVTYNNTFAADGTRQLDGFTVTFDRAIDPTTFGPTDVTVIYRNPNQLITAAGTPVAVASVTAIDENPLTTVSAVANRQFFVRFAAPQSAVGTYSYSIGPDVRDRVRNPYGVSLVPAADKFTQPFTSVGPDPEVIPDGIETFPGSGILQKLNSQINVPALPPGQVVGDVIVTVNIDARHAGDLKLQLYSPSDTTFSNPVTLANALGGAGDNYTFTRFDESASASIAAGAAPFTGTFRPTGLLSNFIGQSATGMWVLRITDSTPFDKVAQSNHAAMLLNWSITIVPGEAHTGTAPSLGAYLDQDADARSGTLTTTFPRSNDVWAVPDPVGSIPFALPYVQDSLPLSIPGPYVRPDSATEDNVAVAGQAVSTDNLVLNGTTSSLDITFDRDMNPGSFTAADIVRINSPVGVVYDRLLPGQFPVASVGVLPISARTFRVTFPEQKLSGSYSIVLSPDITSASGFGLDQDRNAGRFRLLGDDPTSDALTVNTYTAPATPVTVQYRGSASLSLDVTDDYIIRANTLSHIQVKASFTASVITDLVATLVAPDGTRVRLFGQIGAGGPAPTGLINLVFDDAAAPPIQKAIFPFNNNPYTPQLPLSALLGKGAKGTWRLEVNNAGANPAAITDAVLNSWSLLLPQSTPNTGLSVPEADQLTVAFRIFTQDPTNDITRDNWTQVGPASQNNGDNVGSATAIAVDPSDPSGNTVYVGGASGGVWKTTNFLTDNPNGPSWVPLTDAGPANGLNIGSIALFPRNNDPNQTIVYALTGDPNRRNDVQADPLSGGQGVGVLRSLDGGRTWTVLDSTNNTGPLGSFGRDNVFFGSRGNKIIVDPTPAADGEIIVYMALSGNNAQNGLWRSNTSGRTWSRIGIGAPGLFPDATDVVLAAGSAGANGNLETLYVAYPLFGVFITSAAPSALVLAQAAGGQGNPLIRDITSPAAPEGIEVTVNGNGQPTGFSGRVKLVAPALTDSPLLNSFYSGWLYAAVSAGVPGQETFSGLFMTKDFGRNWTPVRIPALESFGGDTRKGRSFPTNDENQPDADPTDLHRRGQPGGGVASYAMSLAIDPTDPNVVYLAGLGTTDGAPVNSGGSYRIDTTIIRDPESFVFFNNGDNTGGGAPLQVNTIGGAVATGTDPLIGVNKGVLYLPTPSTAKYSTDFINLSRDPLNPFIQNSTLRTHNVVTNFTNDGKDVSWQPFTQILSNGQGGANEVQTITSYLDPLTRRTRLVFGTGHGVFTGVDDGQGAISPGIGFSKSVSFSRNGNLQLSQFYAGAVQTSQFAADIAGSLFYGMSKNNGFPVASKDIFRTGNLNWTNPLQPGPDMDGVIYNFSPSGTGVAVDPQGTGAAYEYRQPYSGGDRGLPTDFFRYFAPGTNHAASGTSRTFGLLQAGDNPGLAQGQWPLEDYFTGYFATNPFNSQTLAISSAAGQVFRTTNQGVNWFVVAFPGEVNGQSRALAFGAPEPLEPGKPDDFMLVGNRFGEVFVTNTGDGNWTNTGLLDGTAVQQIVADPTPGSRRAFAVTEQGVWFNEDVGRTATANFPVTIAPSEWVDITGNLFQLRKQIFGSANLAGTDAIQFALRYLTSIQADWRYNLPIDPTDPSNTDTTPILYVAGEGGVFRSRDRGTNWEFFPQIADGAAVQGGYLPNVKVSDLDLSIGAIDGQEFLAGNVPNPNYGKYKPAADNLNMLVATTFGRGTYAIRLDTDLPPESFQSGPVVSNLANPNPVGGPSSILNITFKGAVDAASFKTGDVILLDPTGKPVTVTAVSAIPPTPGTPDPRNFYQITFAQQTQPGLYKLTVGPELSDFAGFKMNQNLNGVNGEIDDAYIQYVFLNGLANSLTLDNLPQFVTAGVPATFTVTARDASGNALTGLNQPVTITISDANPLVTIPTTVNLVNGVAVVSGALITAGQQKLNFTSANLNPTQGDILVKSAAATKFDVVNHPTPVVAGTTNGFTVVARDPFNNIDDAYAGTIRFTSTDPLIVAGNGLPADSVLTKGVGAFTTTFKTANTAAFPSHTLKATDIASAVGIVGAQTGIVVIPAAATTLTLAGYPAVVVAGEAKQATITALDPFGNVATGYTGTLGFTSTDGKVSVGNGLPLNGTLTAGVGVFDVTLKTAGPQTVTATDTANGKLTVSASTTVKAAVAANFLVDIPVATTTAGDPQIVSVQAKDQFDNLAVGYAGVVHFTSSDAQVATSNGLPPDTTLINGAGKFTVTLKTAGTQSVTATDSVTATVTGSDSTQVTPAAASKLTLSPLASPVNAGQATPFTVVAQDIYGNLATTFSDTLSFTSNDPLATLPPPTVGAATSTFSVTFRTSGSRNITVTAAGTGITPVTGSTTVLPGAATSFVLTNLPGTVTAGNSAPFSVAAKDQFGNLATGYTGIIRFTSTDPQAGLPADAQLTSGAGNFAAILKTAGTQSVTATDTTTATLTATGATTVRPTVTSKFTVAGLPAASTAGTAVTFNVVATDRFGNVTPGFVGAVALSTSDSQGVIPASYTFQPADGGTKQFTATFKTAGTQSVTAGPTAGSITFGSASTVVSAAAVSTFGITGLPDPLAGGTPATFTVTAQDQFGNPVTGFTGTVAFTSTDAKAVLPDTYTFQPADGGSKTFSVTLNTGGAYTLTATSGASVGTVSGTASPPPTPPNTTPTISATANAPARPATAAVTVGDTETPAASLILAATTTNPAFTVAVSGTGASRVVTVAAVGNAFGTVPVALTVTDGGGLTATTTVNVTLPDPTLPPVIVPPPPGTPGTTLVGTNFFSAGADRGTIPSVKLYSATGTTLTSATVFPAGFTGGVRTASADFNGDGTDDLVVGTGPGISTLVRVLDGKTQDELFRVAPFEASFVGGVYVTAGDLTGDGKPDLVITPDEGGGPRADVFSGDGFGKVISFFGIDDPNFRGGARAAIGDVNGDGIGDLIVAAGFGGGPRVAGYSGTSLLDGPPRRVFADFFAFEQTLRNGVFIAAGDLDGDGKAEVIAGGGPGGGPRVTAFDAVALAGNTLSPVANFFGGDAANRGGIRVAVKNLDGDTRADLVVGSGTGAGSRVTAYLGKNIGPSGTPATALDFDAFDGFAGGVFVG